MEIISAILSDMVWELRYMKAYASPSREDILPKNSIVTVEPGIYLEGKFGVRIEDFVVVTENGCINMTKAPKELICL